MCKFNVNEVNSEMVEQMKAIHYLGVTISLNNAKMGACISISLDNRFCDPSWPCYEFCYARKMTEARDSVKQSYIRNTDILLRNPEIYFQALDYALKLCEFYGVPFRFHVDGEIPDSEYYSKCVEVVRNHPTVPVVFMTKNYKAVNEYYNLHGIESKPENLFQRFSTWAGMDCDNRYSFPVSDMPEKGSDLSGLVHCLNQAAKKANRKLPVADRKKWTCFNCALHGVGCFSSKDVYFTKE